MPFGYFKKDKVIGVNEIQIGGKTIAETVA